MASERGPRGSCLVFSRPAILAGMPYRGKVEHGVVIWEGEKPADGTVVDVVPAANDAASAGPATHAALGTWKGRNDLPEDPVEASKILRGRLIRRADK